MLYALIISEDRGLEEGFEEKELKLFTFGDGIPNAVAVENDPDRPPPLCTPGISRRGVWGRHGVWHVAGISTSGGFRLMEREAHMTKGTSVEGCALLYRVFQFSNPAGSVCLQRLV